MVSVPFVVLIFALFYVIPSLGVRITTKIGDIEGTTNNDSVHAFKNIPYAEPPIGDLRWRPTKPLKNKPFGDECYDATKWGNACVQSTMFHGMTVHLLPMAYTMTIVFASVFCVWASSGHLGSIDKLSKKKSE